MKEALMLLPGMMRDARIFAPQIEFFSAYRTIVVAPMITRNRFSSLANDILDSAPMAEPVTAIPDRLL